MSKTGELHRFSLCEGLVVGLCTEGGITRRDRKPEVGPTASYHHHPGDQLPTCAPLSTHLIQPEQPCSRDG